MDKCDKHSKIANSKGNLRTMQCCIVAILQYCDISKSGQTCKGSSGQMSFPTIILDFCTLLQETNAMIGGAVGALAAEEGTFLNVIRGTWQKVSWEFQFFMMQCFCDIDIEGEEKFHYQPHSCIHYYQLNADVTLSGINWSHLAAKSWSLRRILDGYVET